MMSGDLGSFTSIERSWAQESLTCKEAGVVFSPRQQKGQRKTSSQKLFFNTVYLITTKLVDGGGIYVIVPHFRALLSHRGIITGGIVVCVCPASECKYDQTYQTWETL